MLRIRHREESVLVLSENVNAEPGWADELMTSEAMIFAQLPRQGARFHGGLIVLMDCAHHEANCNRTFA